ncbi:MAG: aspartate aminotransferase family protein [Pseudohongiellaceae bacterium]|nr:aspartate aminotransferase family protein [Pseudohongiellaceae bacterium]
MSTTMKIEDTVGLTVCKKHPLSIDRGKGVWVWDESGRQYLDFTSGWGVTSLGHSHPAIVKAVTDQAAKLMQNPNSGFTYSPIRSKLLELLSGVLPKGLDRVFFANSGAESNDLALKVARKATQRSKIISLTGSFHGRTLATLSVSGGVDRVSRFSPRVDDTCFVPLGDIEAFSAQLTNDVAAVIIEPVLGEGGARPVNKEYLQDIARLCKANKSLLIIDEVQTGFCRTGRFFGMEYSGVNADILTFGKGIGGGFPFAGVAMAQEIADCVQVGDHGGTYCGNPLACAVAFTVVSYLKDNDIAQRVEQTARYMQRHLAALQRRFPQIITELRGQGLLIGLQLQSDEQVEDLCSHCLDQGLLITPTRDAIVRLLPSLLISKEEVDEGLARLDRALAVLGSSDERLAV